MARLDWTDVLAGYGAGVASLVGLRQILTDRPRVVVGFLEDAVVFTPGVTGSERPHYQLTITNAGRRPVVIVQAGFLAKKGHLLLPADWVNGIPFTLGEGQYRNLLQPKNYPNVATVPIPEDPRVVVRDSVGRWWPRRRRPEMRWREFRGRSRRRRESRP